ncbi:MAG: FimB/Mfa2 family fimbrial subunit [Prevotella sp.]|nr:FimB/Mfa2 family fimbrial subunit [Prevotella sp.]
MRKIFSFVCCCITAALTSCEKPMLGDEPAAAPKGNVVLTFSATGAQTRAAAAPMSDHFQKLNVMLFNDDGTKYFDKVRTQYATDENFGQMSLTLPAGEYTVVAVGHSSAKSATIKSPELVQFTASDGQKLTDTFCYCGQIEVRNENLQQTFQMRRVAAMVQFRLTDESVPENFARMVIAYTGGSANFNPTTSEGTTKSTQSEARVRTDTSTYQVFTFPYLSDTGTLKMTLTAYDADGNTLRQRVFDAVPVARNRITTYTGQFFDGTDGNFNQSTFGFSVLGEWGGEDNYTF